VISRLTAAGVPPNLDTTSTTDEGESAVTDPAHVVRFESRFCGPPGVANGGFACGSLAALADGPAEVTLRRPPPLDQPLEVRGDADGGLLMEDRDGMLVATA
jgi:hypothetical protein